MESMRYIIRVDLNGSQGDSNIVRGYGLADSHEILSRKITIIKSPESPAGAARSIFKVSLKAPPERREDIVTLCRPNRISYSGTNPDLKGVRADYEVSCATCRRLRANPPVPSAPAPAAPSAYVPPALRRKID